MSSSAYSASNRFLPNYFFLLLLLLQSQVFSVTFGKTDLPTTRTNQTEFDSTTIEMTMDTNETKPLSNHTVLYAEKMDNLQHPSAAGIHSTDLILVIGCVFSIAFLSIVVFAIYRYQVRRKAEYQRAAKVQVSSTRNAGVYMDLAMDSPVSKSSLPISVPIYNSMKKRQDQYTFISDDELDL